MLGRFLSPDPHIQLVTDLQSYNRYSYATNNPLRYTDPTGYFFSEIGTFFKNYFSDPANVFFFVTSVAVCAISYGAGCVAWGLWVATIQVALAVDNGAGFKETILSAGIGLGVGIATAGVLNYGEVNPLVSLLIGATAAAVTTGISNVIQGQDFWQYNVLGAALLSAAQGAATIGLQKLAPVSQASLRDAQGGGEEAWGGWGDREAYGKSKYLIEEREFLASTGGARGQAVAGLLDDLTAGARTMSDFARFAAGCQAGGCQDS